MLVRDAMTAGIRIAEPEEMLPHAAKKMRTQKIGSEPGCGPVASSRGYCRA